MKTLFWGVACLAIAFGFFDSKVAYCQNDEAAAVVISTVGTVEAIALDKTTRKLRRGSKLFALEKVVTKDESKIQFRYVNGDKKALESNTTVVIDSKINKGLNTTNQETTLLGGALRSLTGAVRSNDPNAVKLKTNVAVTGVRGTYYIATFLNGEEFLGVYAGAAYLGNAGGKANLEKDGFFHLALAKNWYIAPEYLFEEPDGVYDAFKPLRMTNGSRGEIGDLEDLQESLPLFDLGRFFDDETWGSRHRPGGFGFGDFNPFDFAYGGYFSKCGTC